MFRGAPLWFAIIALSSGMGSGEIDELGEVIESPKVKFAPGAARPTKYKAALRVVVSAMAARPDATLLIEGHTDFNDNAAYSESLSSRRAAAIARLLTKRGIDAARVETVGFGHSMPIVGRQASLKRRAKNRRIVFRLKGDKTPVPVVAKVEPKPAPVLAPVDEVQPEPAEPKLASREPVKGPVIPLLDDEMSAGPRIMLIDEIVARRGSEQIVDGPKIGLLDELIPPRLEKAREEVAIAAPASGPVIGFVDDETPRGLNLPLLDDEDEVSGPSIGLIE